jgi:hypothetical protein
MPGQWSMGTAIGTKLGLGDALFGMTGMEDDRTV